MINLFLLLQLTLMKRDDQLRFWHFQKIQISDVSFYSNGVKIDDANGDYIFSDVNATVEAILHLPGGKGGFGSMLRSIGAQIEKTTNREACRDLSGRRLRDINEETRLRQFVNQQVRNTKPLMIKHFLDQDSQLKYSPGLS